MREWLARVLGIGRRGRRDRELREELRFHQESLAADHEREGLSAEEARRAAARDLGGLDRAHQAWRDQRTWLPLDEVLQDIRYGWRVLWRTPVVSIVAVFMVAVPLAAATSVFSVVDAVLLAPLPYARADRLVVLTEVYRPLHASGISVTPGNLIEWRRRATDFVAMTAVDPRQADLTGVGEPMQVGVGAVTSDFATTVGIAPALGAMFADQAFSPGHADVALISHALWVSRYGAQPDVLGSSVVLDGQRYHLLGVMPSGFLFPAPGLDVWVPRPLTAADGENRTGHTFQAVGRLREGVTVEAVSTQLRSIADTLRRQYPASNQDWDVEAQPARDALVGQTRDALVAVMAAVALLLVVGCANVAGILLTRGVSRGRELAIRTAVGASRRRLVCQLLTESAVLATLACLIGVAVARALIPLLPALGPATLLTWKPIALDGRALGFSVAIAMGACLLFGASPALTASRRVGAAASSRSGGPALMRARQALIASEIALSLLLVMGAALLSETVWHLVHVAPGFSPDRVATMTVALPQARYPSDATVTAFYDALLARLRASSAVVAAGGTSALPLSGRTSVRPYRTQEIPATADLPTAHYRIVTPGYLEAMRIPIVAGRGLEDRDLAGRPLVVVINETLARQAFGTKNPIGQWMTFGGSTDQWAVVVGVVGDVHHFGAAVPAPAEMYWAAAQVDAVTSETLRQLRRNLTIVVAARSDASAVVPVVRAALHDIDPEEPLGNVQLMRSAVEASLSLEKGASVIMAIIGLAALGFTLLGIIGAAAYAVAQRRSEIAVRLALGADPSALTALLMRSTLRSALAGIAAGLGLAWVVTKATTGFSALVVGVRITDPRTWILAAASVAVTSALAGWWPARQAARVDPVGVLRQT